MDTAYIDLRKPLGIIAVAMHLEHMDLDMIPFPVFLSGHIFAFFHNAFREAQFNIDTVRIYALYDGGKDLVLLFDVFIVDLSPFRLADPKGTLKEASCAKTPNYIHILPTRTRQYIVSY